MSDSTPVTGTAVIPAPEPVSSLSETAMAQGRILEDMMGDPSSAYWRGDAHRTAEEYQAHFRNLIRGEAEGSAGPVRPEHADDTDVPGKPSGYELDGLQIFNGETRDLVDTFARQAHDAGFGQARFREAVQWALEQTGTPTHAKFRRWAQGQGWSGVMVKRAIDIFEEMYSRS